MVGKLIVCATPIGNLSDASPRLLDTLRSVDIVAAEDTRRTINLLRHFSIDTRVISYHQYSTEQKHTALLDEMRQGAVVALVSDAGTPGISDPGEELIRDAIALNIPVSIVPGPMAGIAALVISGLPTNRFAFEGFLPRGKRERKKVLQDIQYEMRTLVFYEAPHRLQETLRDMFEAFGDRPAALVRELTKTYEEVVRGTLATLIEHVKNTEVKGEIVLVVGGSKVVAPMTTIPTPEEVVRRLLQAGSSPAQAARQAAKHCGLPRAEAYHLALQISQNKPPLA